MIVSHHLSISLPLLPINLFVLCCDTDDDERDNMMVILHLDYRDNKIIISGTNSLLRVTTI